MRTAIRFLVVAVVLAIPTLAFAQGEVLYVINDKVGIGTGSPADRLHLVAARTARSSSGSTASAASRSRPSSTTGRPAPAA